MTPAVAPCAYGRRYLRIRAERIRSAGGRCAGCGAIKGALFLEAHHRSMGAYPCGEEDDCDCGRPRLSPEDITPLCRDCHVFITACRRLKRILPAGVLAEITAHAPDGRGGGRLSLELSRWLAGAGRTVRQDITPPAAPSAPPPGPPQAIPHAQNRRQQPQRPATPTEHQAGRDAPPRSAIPAPTFTARDRASATRRRRRQRPAS